MVTDPYLSDLVPEALEEMGFFRMDGAWIKANISAVVTSQKLASILVSLGDDIPTSKLYFDQMIDALTTASSHEDNLTMLQIERSLWPAKMTDVDIPAFIVPIKPVWAMHLFDKGIANQDLFGGDPSLILRMENAYYRARRPKVPDAPARVLWYVIRGKGKHQGTMSIRACSYIDEVVIGKPKALFSRFRRLGVYQWQDILRTANENADKEIMAFQFSNTEVFDFPIFRDELQEIWQEETGKEFHIRCPIFIPLSRFFRLYKKGVGLM